MWIAAGIVSMNQPKTLIGWSQKVKQSVDLRTLTGHTDIRTAGVKAGAKSFVSLNQNMVTPQASTGNRGKRLVRVADRFAGRGCWKKQRPFCNGADRKWQLLCEKQADFQQVMKGEKAGRTIVWGNRKRTWEKSRVHPQPPWNIGTRSTGNDANGR